MSRTPSMKAVLRRKGRPQPWVVSQAKSISPTGKKRDRWFVSKEKATAWIKAEEKRLSSYSDKARNLTDEEKIQAAEAIPIAREHGFTILEAVKEKAAVMDRDRESILVSVMVDGAVEQLKRERKSSRHIGTARMVGKKFKAAFGDSLVSHLTTRKIQTWLDSLSETVAPATLRQYRRYLSGFCEHGRLRGGHMAANPIKDIRLTYRTEGEHETISILTPEQVKKLLEVAEPKLRPYLALLAFAGLRPSEAQNLPISRIEDNQIYVSAKSAKTRTHRYAPITTNLQQFLSNAPMGSLRDGKVYWGRRAFRRAVVAAGLDPWQEDVLRHSYGSYRLALDPDENKLAQEMGNSPQIIVTNYRRPVSKKQAQAYFDITP